MIRSQLPQGEADGSRRAAAQEGPGRSHPHPRPTGDAIRHGVIEGPAKQGLDRANWTPEELADHLKKTHGITTSRSAMHRFCSKIGIRPYRPTDRPLLARRPGQAGPGAGGPGPPKKGAAGELVLLSPDETRFQMVPTLAATLGVKGHRPVVGTRDCKDVLYVFGVLNLITGAIHSSLSSTDAPRSRPKDTPSVGTCMSTFVPAQKTFGVSSSGLTRSICRVSSPGQTGFLPEWQKGTRQIERVGPLVQDQPLS
jgi:hypothetical protein